MNKSPIIGITVTYGDRWHLLRRVIQHAKDGALDHLFIVSNGASQNIEGLADEHFGGFCTVVSNKENTGSAGGFETGMRRALKSKGDYFLLLDDDNCICADGARKLFAEHQRLSETHPDLDPGSIALLGYRPEHQLDVKGLRSGDTANPITNAFFGFDVLDIPRKIWSRMPFRRSETNDGEAGENLRVGYAPWSGLFLHRKTIEAAGFPRRDFVLYADDLEYSARLAANNVKIFLCKQIHISDIDASWNLKSSYKSSLQKFTAPSSEYRAYYGIRNQTYLEARLMPQNARRIVNRYVYIVLIVAYGVVSQNWSGLRLFWSAYRAGLLGKLGVAERFPL